MTTSQQKLLPWLSNLVTKTIDQGLPVLPEVLFYLQKVIQKISFRQSESGQSESFSILSALLFSAMLCSSLLFCSVLCSSLLCGFSGREMPFSGREIAFSGREKTMGIEISPDHMEGRTVVRFSFLSIPRIVRKIDHEWSTRGNIFRSVQAIPQGVPR